MGKPLRIGKGKPGPGRPKGTPNKITANMREAFQQAFDGMGGVDALIAWGIENPSSFYPLASKLIPLQVTGKDGEELVLKFIQGAKPDP